MIRLAAQQCRCLAAQPGFALEGRLGWDSAGDRRQRCRHMVARGVGVLIRRVPDLEQRRGCSPSGVPAQDWLVRSTARWSSAACGKMQSQHTAVLNARSRRDMLAAVRRCQAAGGLLHFSAAQLELEAGSHSLGRTVQTAQGSPMRDTAARVRLVRGRHPEGACLSSDPHIRAGSLGTFIAWQWGTPLLGNGYGLRKGVTETE